MKVFAPLYKKASTGKLWSWSIAVDGNVITETWGEVGGKQQSTSDTIREGKNIGRANETSPDQQAEAEAKSKWEKKLKAHNYTEVRKDAEAGKSSEVVEGGILPMLAKRYDEDGDKIIWPCAAQHKYDGHRCIAIIDERGEATLWSRTRKQIYSMTHIQEALKSLKLKNTVLDGELYNVDYHNRFEELTHFIKQTSFKDGCDIINYHIYDIVTKDPYSKRLEQLGRILRNPPEHLIMAETVILDNEDDMMLLFEQFLKEGYEGLMLRNLEGRYVNKRSSDLQKVKSFKDSEFKITGVIEGRGRLAGHGIFLCVTEDGTEFEAKMMGEIKELKKFYEHPEDYIGKMLTVKYQGITAKSKVPRFPVALRLAESL